MQVLSACMRAGLDGIEGTADDYRASYVYYGSVARNQSESAQRKNAPAPITSLAGATKCC